MLPQNRGRACCVNNENDNSNDNDNMIIVIIIIIIIIIIITILMITFAEKYYLKVDNVKALCHDKCICSLCMEPV